MHPFTGGSNDKTGPKSMHEKTVDNVGNDHGSRKKKLVMAKVNVMTTPLIMVMQAVMLVLIPANANLNANGNDNDGGDIDS